MHLPVFHRSSWWAIGLMSLSLQAFGGDPASVARIGERSISLEELDTAGGHAVYEAREQLYATRVRALYQLLSNELLEREAASRNLTLQQLTDQEITPQVSPVSAAELETFLKAQGNKAASDTRSRKQVQVYLGMKRQADAKRDYVSKLFEKYKVQVALAAPPPPPAEEVRGAREPVLGNVEAPVTIIAFSDYRCPYCRELSQTLHQLLERFPKDVRIVYRHYPLHEDSRALAQGALCAADQGQFEPYHDAIFARNAGAKDVEPIASALKLDLDAFKACLSAGTHVARIDADQQEGQRLRINGTPTLFVEGQRLRGAQTLQRLSASVQEALRARTVAANDPKRR